MLKFIGGAVCAGCLVGALSASADSGAAAAIGVPKVWQDYPRNSEYQLENPPQKIGLPVHCGPFDFVILTGKADTAALNEVLKPENLASKDGTLQILMLNSRGGEAGKYREYVVEIRAVEADHPEREAYFIRNIQLTHDPETDDIAIRMGRQVWGYPKTPALIDLAMESNDFSFKAMTMDGEDLFSAKCRGCMDKTDAQAKRLEMPTVSPLGKRTWTKSISEGPWGYKPYDASAGDEFDVNAKSIIGELLAKVKFTPGGWVVGKEMYAVELKNLDNK